jgi:3-hydroxybutyryl-CoA dehydrogenase
MKIGYVGVVGAGATGSGIVQALAVAGINVVIIDVSDAALVKAKSTIDHSLQRLVTKGKVEDPEEKRPWRQSSLRRSTQVSRPRT